MPNTRIKVLTLALLLLAVLTGCQAVPLYETRRGVSVYLDEEPTVERDYYKIDFRFSSPTDDPHLIQWIELNGWTGVEAFRPRWHGRTGADHHYPSKGTTKQYRRITIAPGKVEGADETSNGFSMLPSEWPDGFNSDYREHHKIQGRVVYRRPEYETVYLIEFKDGVLIWSVEGTDIQHRWEASDGRAKED